MNGRGPVKGRDGPIFASTVRTFLALVLGSPIALIGCESEDVPRDVAASVRDSAGVRIVEHPGPLPGTPVPAALEWEHGFRDGDYLFQRVFVGAVRPDGSAVVVDGGNRQVVEIDSSGTRHTLLAESGQGPTEVRAPRVVLVRGDTTWVEDPGNTKLMRFEGSELSSSVNTGADETLAQSMMPLAVTDEGRLLMVTSSYRSRFEREWLDGHVAELDWETMALDTISAYPMASRRPETGINPFGHGGFVAGFQGGYAQGRTDLPEVSWRDSRGSVREIVRWAPELVFPTQELWREFEEGLRAELRRINPQMAPDRVQEFVDERVAAYSLHEEEPLPLFGRMLAGRDGSVWLPSFSTIRQRPTRYVVLAKGGEDVSVVDFPRPVQVLDVSGRYALGLVEDALGVQGVAVYRIDS